MNFIVFFPIRTLLITCAILTTIWASLPAFVIVALGCLGAVILIAEVPPMNQRKWVWKWEAVIAGACTLTIPIRLLLSTVYVFDNLYAMLFWLFAAAIFPLSDRFSDISSIKWRKVFAMTWAFFGSFIWLGNSYLENLRGAFYAGLLLALALLLIFKLWFRIPNFGIQLTNTLILFVLGLPIADLFIEPHHRTFVNMDPGKKYYSFEAAKKDPDSFASWRTYSEQQWKFMTNLLMPDPAGVLWWRLKPSSHAIIYGVPVSINSKGFRGREIPDEKGNTYRIVALGESTTFGTTLTASDKPWTEFLEQIIQEKLKPQRPVQVINAGVPSYNLEHNLYRLPIDILPLKPDMIISYHGLNGFHLLNNALPRFYGHIPPAYKQRPLKLLADCEYRLKMMLYSRKQVSVLELHPPTFSNALQTKFASDYEQMIQITQTNHVRLVLANYSMAVNDRSDVDVVEFYRGGGWPSVHYLIRANIAHSLIIKQLAQQHPEVCFVDTHPRLDGEHDKFIDLVHFNENGERQLAETIFAGIRKVVEKDLAAPDSTNPER